MYFIKWICLLFRQLTFPGGVAWCVFEKSDVNEKLVIEFDLDFGLQCRSFQCQNEGVEKLQNCVKAAIAFVCITCKRQLLFALFQQITFVCTTAIENILKTIPIVNLCMPYCNCQHFWEKQHLYGLLQPLQSTSHYYSFLLLNAQ